MTFLHSSLSLICGRSSGGLVERESALAKAGHAVVEVVGALDRVGDFALVLHEVIDEELS